MSRKPKLPLNVEDLAAHLASIGLEGDHVAEAEAILGGLQSTLADRLRKQRNRARLRSIDAKKDAVPARDVLSPSAIDILPRWVKDGLETAVIVGSSRQVVQLADGRKYHLLNRLNDLSGAEWTYFLNSVIRTRFPTVGDEAYAFEIRRIHPSPKPPQLMRSIIEFFTREGETVFDYFMGVGGTLLGAALANRRAVGIDMNPAYVEAYKRASSQLGLVEQSTHVADSIAVLRDPTWRSQVLGAAEVALILIDPPYGDMMSRPKTGQAAKSGQSTDATPYSELETDLGNMEIATSIALLTESVENAMGALSRRGHVVVFMKDLQPTKESPNLLHADVITALRGISGLSYLGMRIWADESVNLYPYGYPHAYVANQIHQYILIFRAS